MDERRTGEEGYRRPVLEARGGNPQVPGRPIEPFGYTEAEVKAPADGTLTDRAVQHREPLGHAVRLAIRHEATCFGFAISLLR